MPTHSHRPLSMHTPDYGWADKSISSVSHAPSIVISSLGGLVQRKPGSITGKDICRGKMLRRILSQQLEGPRGKRFGPTGACKSQQSAPFEGPPSSDLVYSTLHGSSSSSSSSKKQNSNSNGAQGVLLSTSHDHSPDGDNHLPCCWSSPPPHCRCQRSRSHHLPFLQGHHHHPPCPLPYGGFNWQLLGMPGRWWTDREGCGRGAGTRRLKERQVCQTAGAVSCASSSWSCRGRARAVAGAGVGCSSLTRGDGGWDECGGGCGGGRARAKRCRSHISGGAADHHSSPSVHHQRVGKNCCCSGLSQHCCSHQGHHTTRAPAPAHAPAHAQGQECIPHKEQGLGKDGGGGCCEFPCEGVQSCGRGCAFQDRVDSGGRRGGGQGHDEVKRLHQEGSVDSTTVVIDTCQDPATALAEEDWSYHQPQPPLMSLSPAAFSVGGGVFESKGAAGGSKAVLATPAQGTAEA
ncbi:unnamed protein product, partial [Discosporangium mesarthrocarpum]